MSVCRICCIDDNLSNLKLLEKALEDKYEVYLVDSSDRAIERIVNVQPTLVLLDVNMPH